MASRVSAQSMSVTVSDSRAMSSPTTGARNRPWQPMKDRCFSRMQLSSSMGMKLWATRLLHPYYMCEACCVLHLHRLAWSLSQDSHHARTHLMRGSARGASAGAI